VEEEYRIECEECDALTIVLVDDGKTPKYCPMCGEPAEVEDITDNDI